MLEFWEILLVYDTKGFFISFFDSFSKFANVYLFVHVRWILMTNLFIFLFVLRKKDKNIVPHFKIEWILYIENVNGMKQNDHIKWNILVRAMNGELSGEEKETFEAWMSDPEHGKYYERMVAEWNGDAVHETNMSRVVAGLEAMLQRQRRQRRLMLRRRLGWSAAAVLLVGIVGMFMFRDRQIVETGMPVAEIIPGGSKAILMLADGTSVHLDKTTDTSRLAIGVAEIARSEGKVTFTDDEGAGELAYNTIIIPKGGEYHVVLSDGSEIWLNADSKLQFPVNFREDERRVILSGEAYFKVAHDSGHPFVVETDLGNVKVYGTEFNVKRYAGEKEIKTTLVNGSVGFCTRDDRENYIKIEPGYQLSYENGEKAIVRRVKVDNEIAWKGKQFRFERCPLDEIMNDVMRWYDVDIAFGDESLRELYFTGTLNRYARIESLLRFFEAGCDIRFEIKGRNIVVMKK